MAEYFLHGRLAEDGQEMEFPVVDGNERKPLFLARFHVHRSGDAFRPYRRFQNLAHRLVFDGDASFPFSMYTINYASKGLDEVPASDRAVLEK
ncbi:MAG: hypothetical protein HYW25_03740 [Candidatus Aenigmarchaeota archaeon]|nr:hypothetical protein [Candidatus Aenigmarchaeota archaeon]